jgi:hypothetical protein
VLVNRRLLDLSGNFDLQGSIPLINVSDWVKSLTAGRIFEQHHAVTRSDRD